MQIVIDIDEQDKELIEQTYQRWYKAGVESSAEVIGQACENAKNDGIAEGRNEAWEAARKVIKMGEYSRKWEVFPELGDGEYPFDKLSASEAIAKIKAYEEQKTKTEHLTNFCENMSCLKCVLNTSDFACGRGCSWKYNAKACGDVDKAYELVTEYENKRQATNDLAVGDEVTFLTVADEAVRGVVIGFYPTTHEFRIMRAEGSECYAFAATKTGRHFPEIAEVLKKMKEGE